VALTLATKSGTLAKTGFTFTGWNTAADGSGTSYAAGSNYTANAALTLYAKWGTWASATGGTVTENGGYRIHTFTSGGTLTVTAGGAVEYLIVAGGGGSVGVLNSNASGAGGAGGLLHNVGDALLAVSAQSYPVVVGAGGAGGRKSVCRVSAFSHGGESAVNPVHATINDRPAD